MYIWAGPHHLHYTALPEWASTLGMIFSVMLWMPSWGGMINGLLTLRGAWDRWSTTRSSSSSWSRVTVYGMATFEGPMLSIKSVNALAHYTDWIIAHVHAGALGWNGFMTFGMIYWLLPRLFQTKLHSVEAGRDALLDRDLRHDPLLVRRSTAPALTQGLMWRAFDDDGRLQFPDFIETTMKLMPDVLDARPRRRRSTSSGVLLFGWQHPQDLAVAARRCTTSRSSRRAAAGAAQSRRQRRRGFFAGLTRSSGHRKWEAPADRVHGVDRARRDRRVALRDHSRRS